MYMFDMFSFMDVIFPLFFIFVFGMIIFTIIRGIKEWNSNNKQPVLTVAAKVVTKRTNTSRHHHENHSSASTSYYVTFEVESGDRMEFHISGKEYGLLAEGDIGKLTFQGTRYHNFERVELEQ
ncbi:Protein of unknown function [Tissierella praeacuta DSM 18095]|uniref:DUF2500 domain-containing protein n=1 Tax=Tissierella praeacuta DSM 18095 TaxID=1123404 RepID=A0A1M4XZQ3_9FIRM|nr:DUF2500 domain-containing protein [Tissierella praeacuta]SHE98712.1 Protein of unknown function [Tissierella praeacuta DSM 18095]SUP03386.1 Protein of uncharacterised function (DUF2500) [Tissierella praeacuta]